MNGQGRGRDASVHDLRQALRPKPAPAAATPRHRPDLVGRRDGSRPPEPGKAAETEALDAKVKDLASKVDELTAQIKTFEGKLSDLGKPEAAPEVKSLDGKVAELAKVVA